MYISNNWLFKGLQIGESGILSRVTTSDTYRMILTVLANFLCLENQIDLIWDISAKGMGYLSMLILHNVLAHFPFV